MKALKTKAIKGVHLGYAKDLGVCALHGSATSGSDPVAQVGVQRGGAFNICPECWEELKVAMAQAIGEHGASAVPNVLGLSTQPERRPAPPPFYGQPERGHCSCGRPNEMLVGDAYCARECGYDDNPDDAPVCEGCGGPIGRYRWIGCPQHDRHMVDYRAYYKAA